MIYVDLFQKSELRRAVILFEDSVILAKIIRLWNALTNHHTSDFQILVVSEQIATTICFSKYAYVNLTSFIIKWQQIKWFGWTCFKELVRFHSMCGWGDCGWSSMQGKFKGPQRIKKPGRGLMSFCRDVREGWQVEQWIPAAFYPKLFKRTETPSLKLNVSGWFNKHRLVKGYNSWKNGVKLFIWTNKSSQ